MNFITKFVNRIDEALSPLNKLVADENFRGEFLKELGAKEKPDAASKAKIKEKLNFVLELLNKLRKKLGLDKSDIPNVSNIVALGMILAELYKVWEAIDEMLKACDYSGPDGEQLTAEEEAIAISNARRALATFLTHTFFRKKAPEVAIMFDAMGIFSDEGTEAKRAFDLLLFPILKICGDSVDKNALRPLGDKEEDDWLRITKSFFLILSIGWFVFLHKHVRKFGTFLFNLGYELPADKDVFPNAAKIANRVLQMQFIPGELFIDEVGDFDPEDFRKPNSTDSIFSFVSIPVFPANATDDTEPEGYQFVLSYNLNPGEFGSEVEGLRIRFPSDLTNSIIWGHKTPFHAFNPGILSTDPLVEIQWLSKKETSESTEDSNTSKGGDVFFRIHPKKKVINSQEQLDAEFSLVFKDFSLAISGEGRDGFLQKLLPDKAAANVKVSLSIIYSALLNKWTLEGLDMNDGLLFSFNITDKDFKALQIPTLYAGLKPLLDAEKSINGFELETSALLKSKLGPFQMTVDRLGLLLSLDFAKKAKSNLGFADLSYGLKTPTAVGFSVNAACVSGGGVLSFDPDNHQYYGGGELTLKLKKFDLSLKVFSIVLTQMPDGTEGYSFLLMASVEFNPRAQAPLGFKIRGFGVLAAIHRSINLEAFQSAIRDDRFDLILFPNNPVGDAPTIVKALNSLFPAVQDRYVFAFMARMAWVSDKLIDLKLGLLVEVPSPIKIAVVGVVKVIFEKAGKKIVKLQVNFVIGLDFGKELFSVDAAIYDSKFLTFDIRGELYVRYGWGNNPAFLISLGGWHPDFQVPAGLNLPAKPQRITIPLWNGDHTKIIISFYVALTSNTLQGGFKIDFKIKWSKFKLEADLSIDALIYLETYDFVVNFEGKLRIYWGDNRLAGITVKGKFSGTDVWRIQGTATFEIWIWDYDVDFDESTGDELPDSSQSIQVLSLIEKEIGNKENWQAVLPNGVPTHVVLRNAEEEAPVNTSVILADPISRIEVIQRVVPLGVRVDKIGSQRVAGARTFDVKMETASASSVEEFFAPAMYLNLEDAEKLTRKSYESMKAGQSFGDNGTVSCGKGQVSAFNYDDNFHDPLYPDDDDQEEQAVSPTHFSLWLANNSIAKSAEGKRRTERQEIASREVATKVDPFVLTDAFTGAKVEEVEEQKTMTEAYYELWKLQKTNPLKKLNVVRESDLVF